MNEHEDKLISVFIAKDKKDRYRLFLNNPKKRKIILDRLNHALDADPKHVIRLTKNTDVKEVLRKAGSPEQVYVISDTQSIDGKIMSLDEAITETFFGGWGTIISCIPGELAYYYGEIGKVQALLKRRS